MTEILTLIPLLFLSALESHSSKPLRKACSNVTMDWERREVSRRKCGSAGHILKGKDAHLHFLPAPPPPLSPSLPASGGEWVCCFRIWASALEKDNVVSWKEPGLRTVF